MVIKGTPADQVSVASIPQSVLTCMSPGYPLDSVAYTFMIELPLDSMRLAMGHLTDLVIDGCSPRVVAQVINASADSLKTVHFGLFPDDINDNT